MPRDSRDRSPDSRDRGRSGSPKRGRSGSPKRDDRDRSGSPKRDRSGSRARSEERPRSEERREPSREREGVEIMKIDNDSAAFVLGRGGSTKRKIERVSETKMDLDERAGSIEIFGTDKQRQRARDYVNFVDQQRKGAVVIEVDDRDDVRPTAHRATPRTAAESGESKQLGRRRDGRCSRPTLATSLNHPPHDRATAATAHPERGRDRAGDCRVGPGGLLRLRHGSSGRHAALDGGGGPSVCLLPRVSHPGAGAAVLLCGAWLAIDPLHSRANAARTHARSGARSCALPRSASARSVRRSSASSARSARAAAPSSRCGHERD